MLSDRAWQLFVCPACSGRLARTPEAADCTRCRQHYPVIVSSEGPQPDLRLRTRKRYRIEVELGSELPVRREIFRKLPVNPSPEVDVPARRVRGMTLTDGNRLTNDLIGYFPRASQVGGFMLDLGCGGRDVAKLCARTNLEYIGMDYSDESADVLGDAHALPFCDDSFDFILSLAVLEHLRYPMVAMREAFRVLRPGGVFIGTVAFLEPFHMDSYYHHTHLGTLNSLATAGFDVEIIAPNPGWSGLQALASMSLFPRLPRFAAKLLTAPLNVLHRLWWMAGHALDRKPTSSENYRTLTTTGGYRFIAHKPAPAAMPLSPQMQTQRDAVPAPRARVG